MENLLPFKIDVLPEEDDYILNLFRMRSVTPPTRHRVSSEGSFFFSSLINFKLVHSYNVKYLTRIIFYSSGLQNIYKLHIWKCSTFTIFTLFTKSHIQNRPKGLLVGTY